MKKILAFGDSVLKGIVLQNGKYTVSPFSFTKLIESQAECSIINKGHMGHTVHQLTNAILRTSELFEFDASRLILLEYGGNDCDYNWKDISTAPDGIHNCNVPRECFVNEYIHNVNTLKSLKNNVWLLSLPPIDGNKYYRWISQRYNGDNILRWLNGDPTFLAHWHEIYNLSIFKIGKATDSQVIDITTPFLEKTNYTNYLCEDGIHPNESGHRLIAEVLISALTN